MSPRILLLSLERATERRARSLRQLRAEGADFEIVDAVDGLQCLPLPQKTPGKLTNRHLGCYLSHLRAYARIVAYGWPHGIILEDDFTLLRPGEMAHVLEDLPPGWDFLKLHNVRFGNDDGLEASEYGEKFNRLRSFGISNVGYAVSHQFAEDFLAHHSLPAQPVDLVARELSRRADSQFYELAHPLVGNAPGPSFIDL